MDETLSSPSRLEVQRQRAADQLLPIVYEQLRQLAHSQLAAERPGQTLDTSALVHEAYLRLVGPEENGRFSNRRYFFAAAAKAMRRILIDNARRKNRLKHGGGLHRSELTDQLVYPADDDLLGLDRELLELEREDSLAAKVVELRYFGGLRHAQVAETLEISVYLARQKWTFARAWLRDALRK